MNNFNFDEGYKEYTINNNPNRVIRFNPTDVGIIERFSVSSKALEEITTKINEDESDTAVLAMLDAEIKKQIDFIFNQPVSDVVFGAQSPMAPVGGKMLFECFLEAVLPEIKANIEREKKESVERVGKYVKAAQKH